MELNCIYAVLKEVKNGDTLIYLKEMDFWQIVYLIVID